MKSTSTDHSLVPSAPVSGSDRAVPSLEALQEMTSVPDRRVVFRDVDWTFYEQLVDSIPEWSHIHVDYDGKDLEVMGKGPKHEAIKKLLGYLVWEITKELETPCESLGETTWKRLKLARGLEADECYCFQPEKVAAHAAALARDSNDIADYPNPDLAIEVDISAPLTDRAGIYSALKVTEVWRFVGDQVIIERLGDDGAYHPAEASAFLLIRAEEVWRWVVEEDSQSKLDWARRLLAWVRAELAPRRPR